MTGQQCFKMHHCEFFFFSSGIQYEMIGFKDKAQNFRFKKYWVKLMLFGFTDKNSSEMAFLATNGFLRQFIFWQENFIAKFFFQMNLSYFLKYWKVWLAFNGRKLSGLFSLKSNHILSNRSKSINCQHFYSMYIQDCTYIWFVSWNVGIKIDCPIFDLSILYHIARDLHNILTFHNQVTVRKTKNPFHCIVTER